MSKNPITRLDASQIARTYQAEAKAAGKRLTYNQALVRIALERGYANVHEMQNSYLPSPADTKISAQKLPRLSAYFQPQVWVGDNAIDAPGARAFDAAPAALSLSAKDFMKLDAEMRRDSGRDLDALAHRSRLAGGNGHHGPFHVEVELEDWQTFIATLGLADIAQVTDEKLAAIGQNHPQVTIAKFDGIDIDLSGTGANTWLRYMYRDGANYKTTRFVIIDGRITDRQVAIFLQKLENGEDFIPGIIGLPDLQDSFEACDSYWDPNLDHPWHELLAIHYTDAEPSGDAPNANSLGRLIAKAIWNDSYEPEFAQVMHERYKVKDLCSIAIDPVSENLARIRISYHGIEADLMLDNVDVLARQNQSTSALFYLFAEKAETMWHDILCAAVEDENTIEIDGNEIDHAIIKSAFNWF